MALSIELYQGDSSDFIEIAVYSAGVLVTDLTGYVGKFTMVRCVGDAEIFVKDMVDVSNKFRTQISPAESAALAAGEYVGIAEISNATLDFKKEHHITVTVKTQGYTP